MNISVLSKSGIPIYEQIENQIKQAILDKELEYGESLPSIRSLAADLKISAITTKRAYEDLEKEGMIYSVPGKGFFVDNPDTAYLNEKRNMDIEASMLKLINESVKAGISKESFIEMINLLWEEN